MEPQTKQLIMETTLEDGLITMKLIGEADSVNSDSVYERMLIQSEFYNNIILNLKDLSYCNSKFLGQLFGLMANVDKKNGNLSIVECHVNTYETLDLVGVFKLIPLFSTVEEAKAYFASRKIETIETVTVGETPIYI